MDEPEERLASAGKAMPSDAAALLEDAVEHWGDTVLRLAMVRLSARADAEDVFQTVFLRLFQSGKRFTGDEHLKAWLVRVTLNCCNDVHRSPWRRHRISLEDGALEDVADPYAADIPKADDDLERALARLTSKQRTAVHLHYFEGYSTAEIAEMSGERPATVRSHLHRARKALKLDLGDAYERE